MIDKILLLLNTIMYQNLFLYNNLMSAYLINNFLLIQTNICFLYIFLHYFKKHIIALSDYIYTSMYEHFFGNPNFRLSTVLLFLHSLKKIEPESKILDFGCGSGTYYSNNKVIEIIKKSNLKIEGIDIDPVYIKKCRERVNNSLLENNVNILLKNIFDLTIENEVDKFDYIIFSESAPLLSSKLLESITEYINKNLIKKEGKIIFINNLVENENYMIKYKPLLKYILMIDFGRVLKFKEFDDLSKKINKNIEVNLIDEMSVSEILLFFNLYFLYPLLNLLGVKNYKVKQFEIIMK